MLKLAIVTDIHHGRTSLTKRGDAALALMDELAVFVKTYRPHALIDLGDRITNTDAETDRAGLETLAARFEQIDVPRYHLVGNHDCEFLARNANAAALDTSVDNRSVVLGEWRLVFWQANVDMRYPHGPRVPRSELEWLQQTLSDSSVPTVVFSHIPLDDGSMRSNYYFQANKRFAGYENSAAITEVILSCGNVVLCVAGHVHWNSLARVGGTPFVTVQSLTESFTTQGVATGAWATLELDSALHWRTYGGDPIEVKVPLGGDNRRWTTPLPAFESLRHRREERAENLAGIAGLILDLDGTLYRGSDPIPGAAEFVRAARAAGIELCAVTNNAQHGAAAYHTKLASMGIDLPVERIVTSADAVIKLLARTGGETSVVVVGSPNLHALVNRTQAKVITPCAQFRRVDNPHHPTADIVIVGISPTLTMAALVQAAGHLAEGARLLATNPDPNVPEGKSVAPETGAVVAFLEAATGTRAEIAGKPSPLIFELALERLGLAAIQVAVVGDNVDTDIAGAHGAGLRSVLVESGNRIDHPGTPGPTVRIPSIAALAPLLGLGAAMGA